MCVTVRHVLIAYNPAFLLKAQWKYRVFQTGFQRQCLIHGADVHNNATKADKYKISDILIYAISNEFDNIEFLV